MFGIPQTLAGRPDSNLFVLPGKINYRLWGHALGSPATQPAATTKPGSREGTLTFLDNTIQGATGTVKLRATIPNPDRYFWPGQFVNVRLVLTMENDAGQNGKAGNIVLVGAQRQTVVVNGGSTTVEGNPLPLPVAAAPRLRDAAGKEFALVELSSQSLTINNSHISQTLTVAYRPRAGQGPPAQLAVPGQRTLVFEVPFTLRDIVLP